jgi:N-glycosidase YbiA
MKPMPTSAKSFLKTGTECHMENAPGDFYWGSDKNGSGKNKLGLILMAV